MNRIAALLAALENARTKPRFKAWRLVVQLPDGSLGYLRVQVMIRERWEEEHKFSDEWTVLDAGDNVVLVACDW